jgi:hypothetical protein
MIAAPSDTGNLRTVPPQGQVMAVADVPAHGRFYPAIGDHPAEIEWLTGMMFSGLILAPASNPSAQTEYQLAVKEYKDASEAVSIARSQRQINEMNKSLGVYQGMEGGQAMMAFQDTAAIVGNNDAERRLQVATERLYRAEAALQSY